MLIFYVWGCRSEELRVRGTWYDRINISGEPYGYGGLLVFEKQGEAPHPHRLGDAVPVAPQAAAPAISAKRRPGAPPRGFLPRPPSWLQVVGCQGEKSLLAVQSLHISQGNDLCACSRVPFSWGRGGCTKLEGVFQPPFTLPPPLLRPGTHILTLTHTHLLSHVKAHTDI